ncbi:hypothetical protein TNIN_53681 [Trichonephila inaurata madagascariensis]|uniref:Uncharacterized protein n=1 Tax=Trichonephila inaurata madagascariensis TaxID=2747483 RepID=A0A8X6XFS9_9ARAC|nr:hypothetical protein TNIN_53681 [Trichonephila inaurata madagascariensis]
MAPLHDIHNQHSPETKDCPSNVDTFHQLCQTPGHAANYKCPYFLEKAPRQTINFLLLHHGECKYVDRGPGTSPTLGFANPQGLVKNYTQMATRNEVPARLLSFQMIEIKIPPNCTYK